MRIYIDFDDVLCETARHLSDLACDLFDRHVPYEAISGFDLQCAFNLSAAEIDALMEHAHRDDFLINLAPSPGGLQAVRELEMCGHDLMIVTGRPASSHMGSLGWLRKYGLEHLPVLHVDKYGRKAEADRSDARVAGGAAEQTEAMPYPETLDLATFGALRFDVAIDDSPIALDLLAPRRDCLVLVYDRPWNRRYAHAPNMRRIDSWSEIVALIGGLS